MDSRKQSIVPIATAAIVLMACLLMPHISKADINDWTWMSGSDIIDQPGVYGTKGTPDAANVPGARGYSVSWPDSSRNLWLFGGYGYDSVGAIARLNDLWRYDTATHEWTWMSGSDIIDQPGVYGTKGTPDAANVPGARRYSISWSDSAGNLWMFGGYGYDSVSMNDLWHYDTATNKWTWMSGSDTIEQAGVYGTKGTPDAANVPGARGYGVSWTDNSGNLWLFGGCGIAGRGDYRNDLWRYDPDTNLWTWMSGSDTIDQPGVYGTKGTPDAANMPGARGGGSSWSDSAGNRWVFGGWGYDSAGSKGDLNDLWRYDPDTNLWTWMGGSDIKGQGGIYGTKGTPDAANVPGARADSSFWTDSSGNLWVSGGWGSGSGGSLNDLWRYDTTTHEWTWMSGSDTNGQAGIYGTKGTPDAANVPGNRFGGRFWTDISGNLWLFGGYRYDNAGSAGYMNDLWRYELSNLSPDPDDDDSDDSGKGGGSSSGCFVSTAK